MYFSVLWAESALIWSLPCAKYKGGVVHITQHIQANESTKTAGHKRILYILSGGRTNIYCELAWPLFPKVHSLFVHSFVRSARPWVLELMNRSGSASLSQPRPGAWILCRWGHETQLDWTLAPIHVCAQRVGGGGHVERAGAGPCWKWAACERGGGGGGGGGLCTVNRWMAGAYFAESLKRTGSLLIHLRKPVGYGYKTWSLVSGVAACTFLLFWWLPAGRWLQKIPLKSGIQGWWSGRRWTADVMCHSKILNVLCCSCRPLTTKWLSYGLVCTNITHKYYFMLTLKIFVQLAVAWGKCGWDESVNFMNTNTHTHTLTSHTSLIIQMA